jgi:lactoylglutathione lyase
MVTDAQQTGGKALPSRILYTMIRVSDLDRSVAFYRDLLGMHEIRRETFTEGQFTLVFMGYSNKPDEMLIELTYNWGERSYVHGTGYGHLALEVEDIFAARDRLGGMGVKIIREPGLMTWSVDETGHRENIAFIEDPDGYKIELAEAQSHK